MIHVTSGRTVLLLRTVVPIQFEYGLRKDGVGDYCGQFERGKRFVYWYSKGKQR